MSEALSVRAGLISDTHGLLRPEAVEFLRGSDLIIHAGDVCDPQLLAQLTGLAPVTAVRGNNDKGSWAETLSETQSMQLGDLRVYVIHDLAQMNIDPRAAGFRVVVSGHSHKPLIEDRAGVLYVNPGSAGPRRFKLPITAAELTVSGSAVTARIVDLVSAPRSQS